MLSSVAITLHSLPSPPVSQVSLLKFVLCCVIIWVLLLHFCLSSLEVWPVEMPLDDLFRREQGVVAASLRHN